MPSRLRTNVGLLLTAVMAANTILVGAAHIHGRHAEGAAHLEEGHRCSHGHVHRSPNDQNDEPAPSPNQDDDCAACRYLAQSVSPDLIETKFATIELVANVSPSFAAALDVPLLLYHRSRAPPELLSDL